jgi:hypothetical protein
MENLTAEQLIAFFQGDGLIATIICFIAFISGVITNIYNQMKREDISLKKYLFGHGKRSAASMSALIAAFFGMMFMDTDVGLYAYFTTGLATDYLINKAPRKEDA